MCILSGRHTIADEIIINLFRFEEPPEELASYARDPVRSRFALDSQSHTSNVEEVAGSNTTGVSYREEIMEQNQTHESCEETCVPDVQSSCDEAPHVDDPALDPASLVCVGVVHSPPWVFWILNKSRFGTVSLTTSHSSNCPSSAAVVDMFCV